MLTDFLKDYLSIIIFVFGTKCRQAFRDILWRPKRLFVVSIDKVPPDIVFGMWARMVDYRFPQECTKTILATVRRDGV